MFQFAEHTLDVARNSLRTVDGEIELRPKSFEVLLYLVENADRVVTKDELIKAIWPNVIVNDESLTHCISEVRNAIGDGGRSIIKTVSRRGYQFAAPVSREAAVRQPAAKAALPPAAFADIGQKPDPLLLDHPSIAVLPFQNMSGDPEQEYFADGIVEEIITALSRFSNLLVIARNSTFTYKGRAVDIKQVGRELGVRYVLEGSLRKAARRVRISGQLIDAASGAHLWADRFDGALEDILDLQDQLTVSVVGAIAPKVEQAETERAKRKPTESLVAYDYFLRGMALVYLDTREGVAEGQPLFARAIELDSDYAAAYAMAAWCYFLRVSRRWVTDRPTETAEAARLAHKAVELGKEDAVSLSRAGFALAYLVHDFDTATFLIDRALVLNRNLASAWASSGWLRVFAGEPEVGIQHFAHFKRLSPLDPLMPMAHSGCAFAHMFCGRYAEAILLAEQALRQNPSLHTALRSAAAANALAGNIERAQEIMARLCQMDPALRLSNLKDLPPLRRREDISTYAQAMRQAGLPE